MKTFKSSEAQSILKYLSFLSMGVVAAILCQTASKDWAIYSNHLYGYYSVHSSWQEMWYSFSFFKEPLYFFPAKLFGELISFSAFVVTTTIILLTVKLQYLTKIVDEVWMTCFFYCCLYLFLFEGTVLRVAYATALIFPALYFIKKERIAISLLLTVLATQIHLTSIVFLLMYPLYYFNRLNWVILALFATAPLAMMFKFSIYDSLFQVVNYFTDKYQVYAIEKDLLKQNSTGLFVYFIVFFYFIISVLLYFFQEHYVKDPFKRTLFSFCILGVVAMCLLHDHVAVAARFGELLLICLVPLLSWLYFYFKGNDMKYSQYTLITIFSGYGIARFVYLFPSLIF